MEPAPQNSITSCSRNKLKHISEQLQRCAVVVVVVVIVVTNLSQLSYRAFQ